jgi:hypothetical protein
VTFKTSSEANIVWSESKIKVNSRSELENASDSIPIECKYQCNAMDESDFQHEKQLEHKISSAIVFAMADDDREYETLGK